MGSSKCLDHGGDDATDQRYGVAGLPRNFAGHVACYGCAGGRAGACDRERASDGRCGVHHAACQLRSLVGGDSRD